MKLSECQIGTLVQERFGRGTGYDRVTNDTYQRIGYVVGLIISEVSEVIPMVIWAERIDPSERTYAPADPVAVHPSNILAYVD